MSNQKEAMKAVQELLGKIETDIKRTRLLLNQIINGWEWEIDEASYEELASKLMSYEEWEEIKVVEWVYDGYYMVGSDEKKYPVPLNYSSKTKLIPGDVLKLRIMNDWKLVYKLIGPAWRNYIKATLSKAEDNKYIAIADDGKSYLLNQAAVTFFKGKPGDEMTLVINTTGWDFGHSWAIEAIFSNNE